MGTISSVDVYGQEADLQLLSRLLSRLDNRAVLDVGGERGSFAEGMLRAGAEELHVFDPHPDNARALRSRFADDDRVTVHECAVSDRDGTVELHVSTDPAGSPLSFGHSLLKPLDTEEIVWRETLTVSRRSLDSLIEEGKIPSSVGVIKVDTEGHDLAVVLGMGGLEADVVMVEHWSDLPRGLGVCPWTTEEILTALSARGFHHFAFIIHRGEFVTLKWDDGNVERGAMGNLIFLHNRVLDRLLPDVLEGAGAMAERAVTVGQRYMRAAADRLSLIGQLEQSAEDRLVLANRLQEEADARLKALDATTAELRRKGAELDALRSNAVNRTG